MNDEPADHPKLFYDLGSPYAYLAFERAERILGLRPILEPILIGGLFILRERGSWSQTDTRQENVEVIERRAAEYGIGTITWPVNWPDDTLRAMRCAVWSFRQGCLEEFTRVAFRTAFSEGEDLSDLAVLSSVAAESRLDADEMLAAIGTDSIKSELRSRTDDAWAAGVTGTPTVMVGERAFYGDDQLEAAAKAAGN